MSAADARSSLNRLSVGRTEDGTEGGTDGVGEGRRDARDVTCARGFKGPQVSQSAIGVEGKRRVDAAAVIIRHPFGRGERNCHMN